LQALANQVKSGISHRENSELAFDKMID
jgi:hypothetical protein